MSLLMATLQMGAVVEELLGLITKPEGVSVAEAMAMAWLAEKPGSACSVVAWNLARDRSNVQHTLGALEKRGLVVRDREPGQPRLVGWYLTERGEAVWRIISGRLRLREEDLEREIPSLEQRVDDMMRVADALHREKGKRTQHRERLYVRPEPTEETSPRRDDDDLPY